MASPDFSSIEPAFSGIETLFQSQIIPPDVFNHEINQEQQGSEDDVGYSGRKHSQTNHRTGSDYTFFKYFRDFLIICFQFRLTMSDKYSRYPIGVR